MLCPRPIIELGKHFVAVAVGEVIELLSDDPAAEFDVPAWCRMKGQEYVGHRTHPDYHLPSYLIRRSAEPPNPQ
jgi:tRNA 2-thiouridine synthesizing protein A